MYTWNYACTILLCDHQTVKICIVKETAQNFIASHEPHSFFIFQQEKNHSEMSKKKTDAGQRRYVLPLNGSVCLFCNWNLQFSFGIFCFIFSRLLIHKYIFAHDYWIQPGVFFSLIDQITHSTECFHNHAFRHHSVSIKFYSILAENQYKNQLLSIAKTLLNLSIFE